MKRQELEKKLRRAGCYLKREGSSHSLWINPHTGVTEAVPRHREIKNGRFPVPHSSTATAFHPLTFLGN